MTASPIQPNQPIRQPTVAAGLLPLVDRALARLAPLLAQHDTQCYRLLDGELDQLYVDVYAGHLVVQRYAEFDPGDKQATAPLLRHLTETARQLGQHLQAPSAWIKLRPRQANTLAESGDLTPSTPVWGALTSERGALEVSEHGLCFQVFLGDGLATGLYLDQRDNRRWVRDHAQGRRCLNTFAYAAAFTVAAAAGGATRTVSVDAAAPALTMARNNLTINGFTDVTQHDLIRGDVLPWLQKMAKRGDRFDLAVLDPPSYSTVKGHRWTAARDYPQLMSLACNVMDRNGIVLACINATTVDAVRLRQLVEAGARAANRRIVRAQIRPPQIDFAQGRMKSLLVQLD